MRSSTCNVFLVLALFITFCVIAHARDITVSSKSVSAAVEKGDDDEIQYHTFSSMIKELSFNDGFWSSFTMIMVSELGDETFIIAAIMAMRHPRLIVLGGAYSALLIMTILSTALGLVVPKLITRKTVARLAGVLYTFFGARLMYIAYRSDPNETAAQEFEELEGKIDAGAPPKSKFRRAVSRFCSPIFMEAFILTFLAEWGDRSQVTTIALATHKNPIGVTVGAGIGHFICTGLAVVGGRMMATRISQRTVAMCGGFLFFIFSAHSFYSAGH